MSDIEKVRLFDNQKMSLRDKTVLMVTHDMQPLIDYVHNDFFKRMGLTTPVKAKYLLNEETYKLEPAISGAKDFDLSNGNTVMYSGTMQLNGVNEDFYVKVKLNYKKK